VYLVNYSSTQLITLASWASTVSAYLPASLLALYSYHVACDLMKESQLEELQRLPSPSQLSILLGVLDGRVLSIWDYLRYSTRRREGEIGVPMLLNAILMLISATILRYVVLLVPSLFYSTYMLISY
jgi:uncharacterized membrane protein